MLATADGAGETDFKPGNMRNAGCVRQPFPDVCMCAAMGSREVAEAIFTLCRALPHHVAVRRCLTMIWYLTDGNERTGGTWIVPGAPGQL